MGSLRSNLRKPRSLANSAEPTTNDQGKVQKRRLKMNTIIRRLRSCLNDGNKIDAVNQARSDTGYSLHEALRLVQHCEGDDDLTDGALALLWCDPCRNSLPACQCMAVASGEQEPTAKPIKDAQAPQPASAKEAQPLKCKCGDSECVSEWHRLAMWLGEDPANYGRLLAFVEAHVVPLAANEMEPD